MNHIIGKNKKHRPQFFNFFDALSRPNVRPKNRSRISLEPEARGERSVQDVARLMMIVLLIAAAVILAGTLAGLFVFKDTIPIYILLVLIIPAYIGAHNGGWKWAGAILVLLCFALAAYGSLLHGFFSNAVLFYVLAVILAQMLFGNRAGALVVIACLASFAGLGSYQQGFSIGNLEIIITFSFGLVGIALLVWYTHSRLQRILAEQIAGNLALQEEIRRRQQAEAVQREQEAQLRRLADNTTDLVTEVDPDAIIRYASPSCQSELGYDVEQSLGMNALDFIHPDDRQVMVDVIDHAAATRTQVRVQVRVRRADGQYIWVEEAGTPLYNGQQELTGFVIASRNITLQKQAEIAIQESEQKFRTIIEALPLGVHMFTLQDDGRLILNGYNPAADKILGFEHAHILGMPIEDAFPGLSESGIIERFVEIARSGGSWKADRFDYNRLPIEGSFELHAFQTSSLRMVVVFADITQRIQAAEALRLSEEKFSMTFHTSPDSVNINRLADGVYLEINQGFTRLMGYTREDTIGKSSLALNIWVDPADRERLVKGLLEHGVVENLEARFRRKNGDIGIGLMSARIIKIQEEKCILSITREITDRILTEITLRENEAKLREAHHKLERAYEATLQGWAHALELRETETANHSQRVVDLTVRLAQELGIRGEELAHIRRGALLHDIGKMGVPDGILLKPSRLTYDEWVTMRQHAEFARDMLSDIEYLHPCIAIPYSHHEKWDGSGYPQGLKETEIPLAARIFAIVDVYDALTHDRPYRPAWSVKDARRYMIEQSGKHFDPDILDLFLKLNVS